LTYIKKPTAIDTIIPQDSCYPIEQKLSAVRYLQDRNTTYLLNDYNKKKEENIIDHILRNNKYATSTQNKWVRKKKEKEVHTQN
jgi:hypothetical protein